MKYCPPTRRFTNNGRVFVSIVKRLFFSNWNERTVVLGNLKSLKSLIFVQSGNSLQGVVSENFFSAFLKFCRGIWLRACAKIYHR